MISLLIVSVITYSFVSLEKHNDKKLVGIWKGFEKDQQIEGVEKHWIVERFKNGNYVIMFTTKQDCEVETFTENGKWWTENGKFYEKAIGSDQEESYFYEVIDSEVVNFKSVGKPYGDKEYVFSDYKIFLD